MSDDDDLTHGHHTDDIGASVGEWVRAPRRSNRLVNRFTDVNFGATSLINMEDNIVINDDNYFKLATFFKTKSTSPTKSTT